VPAREPAPATEPAPAREPAPASAPARHVPKEDAAFFGAGTSISFGPEQVAALVVWLTHEDCEEEAGLFEAGGGFYARVRLERTQGLFVTRKELGPGVLPTPEHIRDGSAALSHEWEGAEAPAMGNGDMGNFPGKVAAHLAEQTRAHSRM
jgi:hypothetical protein